MTEDIKVTFIIPKYCKNENECPDEMQIAFTACEHHRSGGLQAQWVHEKQWKQYDGLTKKDVFVLSEFEGELFDRLKATKCLLVGPRCLACCLTEGIPIPSGPEPVFTVAMRGLVVTASGLSKQQKENIKRKVHWMGGLYNTVLTDDTTHLISDTVLSDKYIKSVEKGIPVMSESWVSKVWETSLKLNVNGSSSDFDVHRLPPFANLQITTSGITKKDKQIIMKLVNENGGVFSGAFQSETTDIVILTKDGIGSEKYKAALEYGKACVLPSWVKESAARGVALPVTKYTVTGASTSSPIAEHRLPDMSLNFSRITNLRPPNNFIDETKAPDMSTLSGNMKLSQEGKKSDDFSEEDKEIQEAFDNFDMDNIRKAGTIFDGFCVWVSGVEGVLRERAGACVSRCGGVRCAGPEARVTHAVAPRRAAAAARRALPAVPVLSPLWVLRSVEAGRVLNEHDFLADTNVKPVTPIKPKVSKPRIDGASPMSKRNINLLRQTPLDLPPPTPEGDEEPQQEIVNHYLSQNAAETTEEKTLQAAVSNQNTVQKHPDITEDVEDEPTEEIEQIFRGLKIEVQGLDDEAISETGAEVASAGGVLAAAGAGGTHVLVPLDFDPNDLVNKDAEAVTVFWVKDCLSQQELLPLQYYHRPVRVPQWGSEPPPLYGVVLSLSTYNGVERAFLDELAKLLGATTQLRFCRRNTSNALASTHLVCPTAAGDKYAGAVKWGLPAVRGSWLTECAAAGRRVSELGHLVGDTKAPPLPEREKPLENEQTDEQANEATNKENHMLPPIAIPRRGSSANIRENNSGENTPKAKLVNGDTDSMSPASRYIAMARQGLLGGDSQETPKRVQEIKDGDTKDAECIRTPPLEDALSTPNLVGLSPTTRRRLQAVRRGEMPSDPIRTPVDPFKNPTTPDSAFGAALRPGTGRMSPEARKRLWKVVQELPSKQVQTEKNAYTPLSEIRNRFLAQFMDDAPTPHSEHPITSRKLNLEDEEDTPPPKMAKKSVDQSAGSVSYQDSTVSAKSASSSNVVLPPAVDAQLQRLSAVISGRVSSPRTRRPKETITLATGAELDPGPESQPNTVGWDDTAHVQEPVKDKAPTPTVKRFMLSSNVDSREEIAAMIEYLGGEVCEGTELDSEATHFLCSAPSRSEKMLGSVAAGRWVLHPAYVSRSRAAGYFLPEEEYEWGNPLATQLPSLSGGERALALAAHRWRARRAGGAGGPFAGLAALLHVPPPRRRLLARLVLAGGGQAPEHEPPYSNENITVCFADIKRYPLSDRDKAWLISRKIPVCAPVLLSSYLTDETTPKPEEHCLPDFRPS